jgi:hypothetical protein
MNLPVGQRGNEQRKAEYLGGTTRVSRQRLFFQRTTAID